MIPIKGQKAERIEIPAHLERIRDKMSKSGCLVFRGLDFMEIFIE